MDKNPNDYPVPDSRGRPKESYHSLDFAMRYAITFVVDPDGDNILEQYVTSVQQFSEVTEVCEVVSNGKPYTVIDVMLESSDTSRPPRENDVFWPSLRRMLVEEIRTRPIEDVRRCFELGLGLKPHPDALRHNAPEEAAAAEAAADTE